MTDGNSIKLSMAFKNAAETMNTCAQIVKMQPKHDELPWIDGLKEYGSMLTQFGDALQSSKEAERKYTEVTPRVLGSVSRVCTCACVVLHYTGVRVLHAVCVGVVLCVDVVQYVGVAISVS